MPADTNPAGDIFGGWLMAQMDLAAGSAAARRARGRCATVAVDEMTFHQPVLVGDEVSFYAAIERVGRTSMVIRVEAWRRSRDADEVGRVTGRDLHLRGDRRRPPPARDPAGGVIRFGRRGSGRAHAASSMKPPDCRLPQVGVEAAARQKLRMGAALRRRGRGR